MMRLRVAYMLAVVVNAMVLVFSGCGDDGPTAPSGGGGSTPLSFDTFQAAAVVIGQPDMSSNGQNGGGAVSALGFDKPVGNPARGSLYFADRFNNRVLGYTAIPGASGVAADFVIGQNDFVSNGSGTTASSFSLPFDCEVAGGKLFVADISNNRVLIWNSLPTTNTPADVVVGQSDFTTATPGAGQAGIRPIDVYVAGGRLFVADVDKHRVMIWNSIPTTNGEPADVVVGQSNFTDIGSGLSATALFSPEAIWAGASRLVISDRGNQRVLIFNSIPTANGAAADVVVGAADFTTAGTTAPTATNLGSPLGVASDGTNLFIADDWNHRVLIFNPFPTANGAVASNVLGQSNFTLGAPNDPNQDGTSDNVASARTFFDPLGIAVIGNQLFVTDQDNYRLLVFNSK